MGKLAKIGRHLSILAFLMCTLTGCLGRGERRGDIWQLLQLRPQAATVKAYQAVTSDGMTIALHRYVPEKHLKKSLPVILCHGLGYNGNYWDIDEEHNFAEYLSTAGFDVWIVDLRGAGASSQPIWSIIRPPLSPNHITKINLLLDWTCDDYINKDLPAAINLVTQETGYDQVSWVAHSMGGIIALGYLETNSDPKIGNLVTIATHMITPQPPNKILKDVTNLRPFFQAINNRMTSALEGWVFQGQVRSPLDILFYNLDNVTTSMVAKVHRSATEDIPNGVFDQYCDMVQNGDFLSTDKSFNYSRELSRVTVPILLITGKADNAAPPEGVRFIYNNVSSKDKTYREFGRANGDAIDYGHNDLILGKNSRTVVYPVIKRWLLSQVKKNPATPTKRPHQQQQLQKKDPPE